MKQKVSECINRIKYEQLYNSIPDILPLFNYPTKRFPNWVYKHPNGIINFETYCKKIFLKKYNVKWEELFNEKCPAECKLFNDIINLSKKTMLGNNYLLDQKVETKYIEANLDIVDNSILEIKTIQKVTPEHILQALAHVAIARYLGHNIQSIIFIYLLHLEIKVIDCKDWNEKIFLERLENISQWLYQEKNVKHISEGPSIIALAYNYPVGRHRGKEEDFPLNEPYQIYLAGNCGGNIDNNEIKRLKSKIENSRKNINNKVFIHSPLNLNIGKNELWISKVLEKELNISNQIKSNGVVVHLGSYKDTTIEKALINMEKNILKLLEYATEECPILLETCAGEKNDICCDPDSLLNFLSKFNEDKRLGLCMDSCHVYSAGYDPVWFYNKIRKYVKCIHYNDSSTCLGGFWDKHAYPSTGYIGLERMLYLKAVASSDNIPLIIE